MQFFLSVIGEDFVDQWCLGVRQRSDGVVEVKYLWTIQVASATSTLVHGRLFSTRLRLVYRECMSLILFLPNVYQTRHMVYLRFFWCGRLRCSV